MKVRSELLTSRRAALLGGAMLMAMIPASGALAADQMPVKAAAVSAETGWYSYGSIEAGSNIFIQKPGSGFGKSATDPFWLTPTTTDSNAKMDEYGKVPRSVFLNEAEIHFGTNDGRLAVDAWADNVGFDNQRYYLGIYEPGRQYFNIGWDQTPHLLSSSAKSIFGGVGSTRLTVDNTTRTFLQANSNPNNQTQRNCIDAYINGLANPGGCSGVFPATAAPMTNIELKTLREKFTVGYRNTMWDNWDFNVDYSHEHRTGTRPLGISIGIGTAANPARTGSVEVPQPLDDKTQIVNAAGEYVGTTPWGTRWNTSVKYFGSYFSNNNKSIDVENPFCNTCSTSASLFGANTLRYGLYPDNNANGVTWNTAVDLPIFKSRYTSTVQYTAFRQNDPFIDDAINGLTYGPGATQIVPYPAAGLNGEVNAFLTNNVLYSHLTHDLTNTARVRYYDRKDNTPTITFGNTAYLDSGVNSTVFTRLPTSHSRLNIEDDLKWQANRVWTFGAGYFFERFVFENGEVDATNESGAKAFVNATWRLATVRSSLQYSQRRYNTYLATDSTGAGSIPANAGRFFFVANRNRTKSSTVVELAAFKNVTISPNGGVRWDEYLADAWTNQDGTASNTLGVRYDRSWNLGSDLAWRVSPELRLTFGYNHEEHYLAMQSCCGTGSGGGATLVDSHKWSSNITQKYDTFMVSSLWNAIPGKLDFQADYVAAIANEANDTTGCSANLTSCTGKNFTTDPAVVWPDEHNIFQRFSILAKYYVDPAYVKQMGWFGQVTAKLRYTWEKNHNTNWATDNFSPYSPSAADAGGTDISNGGRSLFLAYNNPNYSAQIITASIAWKW